MKVWLDVLVFFCATLCCVLWTRWQSLLQEWTSRYRRSPGQPGWVPSASPSHRHHLIMISSSSSSGMDPSMIMMGATEATSPFPSPVTLNPLPVGFVALLYFCCLDSWFCCLALVLLPCQLVLLPCFSFVAMLVGRFPTVTTLNLNRTIRHLLRLRQHTITW